MEHNTRALLIGAADQLAWNDVRLWVNSIRRTTFTGDIYLIGYRVDAALEQACTDHGVTLIKPEADFQNQYLDYRAGASANFVCQRRFFHLWQVLDEVAEHYDLVIHTDTRDVVFQSNPVDWWHRHVTGTTSQLVKSSEGIQYQHEAWGKADVISAFGPYVYESIFAKWTIGNAGTMMGRTARMRDFALNVFTTAYGHPEAADQAAVNLLLATIIPDFYTGTVANGWSAQCGTLLDPSKAHYRPHIIDEIPQVNYTTGEVTNSKGEPVALIHQYHRVPLLNQAIHKRFG